MCCESPSGPNGQVLTQSAQTIFNACIEIAEIQQRTLAMLAPGWMSGIYNYVADGFYHDNWHSYHYLAYGAICVIGPIAAKRLGNAKLFYPVRTSKSVREPLSATMNRHGLTNLGQKAFNFFSSEGGKIAGNAVVLVSSNGTIDMKYLGEKYNIGIKSSQYNKYQSRVADGTAPRWMTDLAIKWEDAHNMNLWPFGECNELINYSPLYVGYRLGNSVSRIGLRSEI